MEKGKTKKCVAIIPARGGSKTLPKKNIIDFCGRPLIFWTIEQARETKSIDDVYVTTDDDAIADISQQFGAKVIKRPAELATDTSSSEDALVHAIDIIEKEYPVGLVVFLQATSPLRGRDDIEEAISHYLKERADSLFSCSTVNDFFVWQKKADTRVSITYDYLSRKPRQKIDPFYLENGSIYIFTPQLIRKEHNRLGGKIAVYVMDSWKSIEVDNADDLEMCRYYFENKLLHQK